MKLKGLLMFPLVLVAVVMFSIGSVQAADDIQVGVAGWANPAWPVVF